MTRASARGRQLCEVQTTDPTEHTGGSRWADSKAGHCEEGKAQESSGSGAHSGGSRALFLFCRHSTASAFRQFGERRTNALPGTQGWARARVGRRGRNGEPRLVARTQQAWGQWRLRGSHSKWYLALSKRGGPASRGYRECSRPE